MSLGIYIQVPFCQTKCTYCNFHTGVVAPDRYAPYADAVCCEIASARSSTAIVARKRVDSVYFGGGTPSLLKSNALTKILDALRAPFCFAADVEITLEADPETITPEKANDWSAAGFNRISLGAQSFNDNELRTAGRMHRRNDIYAAVAALRDSGFRNISLDLISGLPHQTGESWEGSMNEILALRPEHVSIYLLEIDEGSRLGRESLAGGARYSAAAIPSDDAMVELYELASARLADAGYEHYEISNWALPGHRSRHNLKYWRREPYIGFGAGAHSFDGVSRWANVHDSARYVTMTEADQSPREQIESVTFEQAFDEELFLGLRQLEGIDFAAVAGRYPKNLDARIADIRGRLADLRTHGLVEFDGNRLRLAPSRLAVSNEVFVELLR